MTDTGGAAGSADPSGSADARRPGPRAPRARRLTAVLLALAAGVVVADQVTKALAVAHLRPRIAAGEGPVDLLGSFLQLTYTSNSGAAFSMGAGYTWIFSAIAVLVAAVVLRVARRLDSLPWALALGALLGGALGNLGDRLFREPGFGRGQVVDFIQLPRWPVFNVADMCVVTAAVAMVLLSALGLEFDGRRPRRAHPDVPDGAGASGAGAGRSAEEGAPAPGGAADPGGPSPDAAPGPSRGPAAGRTDG